MSRDADGEPVGAQLAVARAYGQKTLTALAEIHRLTEAGARIAARGHDWYTSDPDNVPGLAAESLVVKIGENVARVSDQLKSDHPEVPWQIIKDMRNRLTHYYEATDYEVVWSTVANDLPEIGRMVGGLLE